MRLVSVRQEALYRGYRIEGAKEGECMLLRVIPTKRDLPHLEYSRFRTLHRGTWPKAVTVVCGYIDKGFGDFASQCPQTESYGAYSEFGPTKRSRVEKLLQLRDQLQVLELNRLGTRPMLAFLELSPKVPLP